MGNEIMGNEYVDELKKFLKQEVIVVDSSGQEVRGKCVAIGFQHLNIVVMTDKEKILIKNIVRITRQRRGKEE